MVPLFLLHVQHGEQNIEVFSSQIFCLHPGTLIALNVAVPESETSALKIANVSMDACNLIIYSNDNI